MKPFFAKIALMIVFIFFSCVIFGQNNLSTPKEKIIFEGGMKSFKKNISSYLTDSIETSRYFTILFKINRNSSIQDVLVSCVGDSTGAASIVDGFKHLERKWRNQTNKAIWVQLPIYFEHINDKDVPDKAPSIAMIQYSNWTKQNVVSLEPLRLLFYSSTKCKNLKMQ